MMRQKRLETTSHAAARRAAWGLLAVLLALLAAWPPVTRGQEKADPAGEKAAEKADEIAEEGAAEAKYKNPVIIPVEGPIQPMLQQFVYRRLEAAKDLGADLVILRIESPGGRLDTTEEMCNHLLDIEWAKVVAWVPRRAHALSGAAILSLACDEIVMHPDARIGDAGVIVYGEQSAFKYAPEKIITDLVTFVRLLARTNGYPEALAEAMVNNKAVVYRYTHRRTGEKRLMTEAEADGLADAPDWSQGPVIAESSEDKFLELTGDRAAELGLARDTVDSLQELKTLYGLKQEPQLLPGSWVDDLIYILNLPIVTVFLFVLGAVCLYMELQVPGIGVFGVMAGLCFLMFFWSRILGGTADWLEVVLFVAGVAAILVELFVIPGFGIAGMVGLLLIIGSIILAGQPSLVPQTEGDYKALLSTMIVLAVSGILFMGIAIVLSRHFGSLPLFSRIILQPPGGGPAQEVIIAEDPRVPPEERGGPSALEALVGKQGKAVTTLRPAGKARIDGEVMDVVTEGDYIQAGNPIEVMEIQGSRVVVREA